MSLEERIQSLPSKYRVKLLRKLEWYEAKTLLESAKSNVEYKRRLRCERMSKYWKDNPDRYELHKEKRRLRYKNQKQSDL